MEKHFKGYSVQHIPRDDNNEADKLAKAAARNQELPPDVFFEIIREPSIKDSRAKIVNVVETPDWRAEIMAYLRGHYEPQDELEEKRLKQRARGYTVVNGELYKSGVTEPWLRCITSEKGQELLKEIHSGFCGAHIGTRALAGKAIKQGFCGPTINIDAKTLVRQCEACQKTANQQNLPSMPVHLIPPTWPLQRWGMDLVGPLPTAKGNCRFAAVAVDYFTKWVEAKPLANIKATTVQKFFWQNIVCRFGVPRELTVDNGKQFDCYTFKEYCKTLGTEGPIRRTREGGSEWEPIKILLEGDGNSNKMNTASNTRLRLTTKVGQAHVATGVPLDLGTNTPPSDPRNAAEKLNLESTDPHRSDR
jgi:hypothetical protein